MAPEQLGLRDRKREETRTRLEVAAVTLVLRDGLDHATVDSISSMADVSPRTFFNYFDTKEDAILGIKDIDLTPEVVALHMSRADGADVVESTVMLLLSLISPSIEGRTLHDQRHEVLRRHPQLFGRHMAQMSRMVDPLLDAITTVLENDGSGRVVDRMQAEVLLSLCGGAVRAAVKEWVALVETTPVETIQPRALALIRSVLERVAPTTTRF
jgi:AcrR family transcriptional regulator